MSVINTGSHPLALWPGISKWWGREYNKHVSEYDQIFEMVTSDKAWERDAEVTGFGLAPVKSEGASVRYGSESQGTVTDYINVAYALGYIVTREEIDDNLYEIVSRRRSQALAFSMNQTKEIVAANVLNNGFDSNFVGGDGKELFATDHPTVDGTQSNELAVAADLSEASLEDLFVQIMNATNSRGLNINLMGECLIVPPSLVFEAERIIKSPLQNDTANNALNAVYSMGLLPKGIKVNHYLDDPDAWFVKTNALRGLMGFQRRPIEFTQDNDFDTDNAKAKCYERYAFKWTDFRGIYGSPGA